jgi:TrpR family trp operon transcriptional repressor
MTIDDPRVREQIRELCRVLSVTENAELLEDFISCLLTPSETADIASRWALVKSLRDGSTQREIAKNLGVSLCKITRGSRELKKPSSGFLRILKTLDNINTETGAENGAPCPFGPDDDN